MQGERGELPPRASQAAHLRSGGATEPAIHPSGRGGAQAVRLAHRSRSCENRPGLTARLSNTVDGINSATLGGLPWNMGDVQKPIILNVFENTGAFLGIRETVLRETCMSHTPATRRSCLKGSLNFLEGLLRVSEKYEFEGLLYLPQYSWGRKSKLSNSFLPDTLKSSSRKFRDPFRQLRLVAGV